GADESAYDLHQCALARSVAAHEADDFGPPDGEVDALYGASRSERLGDALHGEASRMSFEVFTGLRAPDRRIEDSRLGETRQRCHQPLAGEECPSASKLAHTRKRIRNLVECEGVDRDAFALDILEVV